MRFAASPQVASFLNQGMNFGDLHQAGQKSQAEQRITATQADAAVAAADLKAEAMIEAAKHGADATRAQGEAAGQSSMFGGITSGLSSLAGGLFSGGGGGFLGGGTTGSASSLGSAINPSTPGLSFQDSVNSSFGSFTPRNMTTHPLRF